jgi:hypothetical protein
MIARRWLVLVTASMGLYLLLPDRGGPRSLLDDTQRESDALPGADGTTDRHDHEPLRVRPSVHSLELISPPPIDES